MLVKNAVTEDLVLSKILFLPDTSREPPRGQKFLWHLHNVLFRRSYSSQHGVGCDNGVFILVKYFGDELRTAFNVQSNFDFLLFTDFQCFILSSVGFSMEIDFDSWSFRSMCRSGVDYRIETVSTDVPNPDT